MKKKLPVSKSLKILLNILAIVALLCLNIALYANIKPVEPKVLLASVKYKKPVKKLSAIKAKALNPQALPVISYGTPQVYTQNTPIAPLAPANTGDAVLAAAYSNSTVNVGTGFSVPKGIAIDAAGNLYVCDAGNGLVKKILAADGSTIIIGSGFNQPYGVAVDATGNVYVADSGNHVIKKIPGGSNNPVIIASGFNDPRGIAVNAAGDIYVADLGANTLREIPAGSNAPVTIGSGFSLPFDVKLDFAGNIYVADFGNGKVKKIPASGGPIVTIGSGFSNPAGVAIDAAGNVFVTDFIASMVKEIPAGSNTSVTLASGFKNPVGVTTDGSGNVFVADNINNLVKKIQPAGGYYIDKLPAGLSFNNATGVISGTPTSVSPATNYTVTAYNATGAIKATVNIKVLADAKNADLSNLTLSTGTLSPIFSAATTNYRAGVPNTLTSITITPATAGLMSTVKVNGVTVASGTASGTIPLALGPNVINTVVTAQDGITTKTYTLTVVRASNNALLSILKVTPSTQLTLVSGANYHDYTTTVPNTETGVKITPTAQDATASIKVNGVAVTSGTASANIPLNIGDNIINTVVTAQDGIAQKIYSIKFTRQQSSNANLSGLKISSGTLTPVFAAGTTTYTASVSNATSSITLTPAASDATAKIKVNGVTVASGTASAPVPLAVGPNVIYTVVTAQDGTTTKTYTLTVTRAKSTNALLTTLKVTPSTTLTSVSGTNYHDYITTVPNTETNVRITPTAQDTTASIKVNGFNVPGGTASAAIPLNVGDNVINTVVTAQDGVTKKTYSIKFTRLPSANASLATFNLSSGTLSPVFTATTTNYTTVVSSDTTSISLTPTAADASAKIKVNGVAVAQGTASAAIPLAIGNNTITTTVTAQNGVNIKNYVLKVTRPTADAADLSDLIVSRGMLNTPFSADLTNYSMFVENAIASITITPSLNDTLATVTVNGVQVMNKKASAPVLLAAGPNMVEVIVTAANGVTTKTYTLNIMRDVPADAADLAGLTLSAGTLAPVFSPNITGYAAVVYIGIPSITLKPALKDAAATVFVNGVRVANNTETAPISLSDGQTISIVVIAVDDVTTKSYTLTIKRSSIRNLGNPGALPVEYSAAIQQPDNNDVVVRQGLSPNGDGVNDFLLIDGIAGYPDNKLTIMSRTGALVYEAKGYDNNSKRFDGHSSKTGQMQQPGNYFYTLDYKSGNETKHKTGFIVLKY